MIIAEINNKNTLITDITDQSGKTMTICSSKMKSEYLSPRQLLQAALAGCLSMTIRGELSNHGIKYEDVIVKVDMVENTFVYQVEIKSDEDISVIDQIKEESVQNCYIRGLLSEGIRIIEGDINEPEDIIYDRCCD